MNHNIFSILRTLEHSLLLMYLFGSLTVSTDEMVPKTIPFKLKPESLPFYVEEYDSYENVVKSFPNQSIQDRSNISSDLSWSNGKIRFATLSHDDNKHMRYRHHHNELGIKRKKLRSVDEFPIANHHNRVLSTLMHWVSNHDQNI